MHPNFLIIGSQKAGTTSLYEVLRRHPQIFLPKTKELNFFFFDDRYSRGMEQYSRSFAQVNGEVAVGEASPGYICHPDCPQRIYEAVPKAKLILIVRNPVERAYSQYWDSRRKLAETSTFEEAYRKYFSETYVPWQVGYFSRGFYLRYIKKYLQYFSREQLLVLMFKQLREEPEKFYQACFDFLGVDRDVDPALFAVHNEFTVWGNPLYQLLLNYPSVARLVPFKLRRKLYFGRKRVFGYPKIESYLRAELVERYREANNDLADFLQMDLSHWSTV